MAVITELLLDTGPVHITEAIEEAIEEAMEEAMEATEAIRVVSRSRLAIGHIILVVLVIGRAVPIMSGARDTGHGVTVCDSGSAATTL
jgi:flavin-binding protein dodecin